MSSDHSFLIAASCSGINFLIASFLMLVIVTAWRRIPERAGWSSLPVSMVAAYMATILPTRCGSRSRCSSVILIPTSSG